MKVSPLSTLSGELLTSWPIRCESIQSIFQWEKSKPEASGPGGEQCHGGRGVTCHAVFIVHHLNILILFLMYFFLLLLNHLDNPGLPVDRQKVEDGGHRVDGLELQPRLLPRKVSSVNVFWIFHWCQLRCLFIWFFPGTFCFHECIWKYIDMKHLSRAAEQQLYLTTNNMSFLQFDLDQMLHNFLKCCLLSAGGRRPGWGAWWSSR